MNKINGMECTESTYPSEQIKIENPQTMKDTYAIMNFSVKV